MADDLWFEYRIEGAQLDAGVDARALADTISALVAAARTEAAMRLGLPDSRGPMKAVERSLAALKITGIKPGSVVLEFAPPTSGPIQLTMQGVTFSADDVLQDLMKDLRLASETGTASLTSVRKRRAIERLLRSSGRLGTRVQASFHAGTHPDVVELPVETVAREVARDTVSRSRSLFGHVYMVDVELGKRRLRVKLPDETDVTMDVDDEAAERAADSLDRIAEVRVLEQLDGDQVVQRLVVDVRVVDAPASAPLRAPISLLELARRQGVLLRGKPDYQLLATALLPTEADAVEFHERVAIARSAAS